MFGGAQWTGEVLETMGGLWGAGGTTRVIEALGVSIESLGCLGGVTGVGVSTGLAMGGCPEPPPSRARRGRGDRDPGTGTLG